mmetsp:Transcript_19680/g.37492  ORF Transcript_19680/g.37492 Transcript_19680/m.37492 type:complete len:97 (+) Transcript_19680:35-325(+)
MRRVSELIEWSDEFLGEEEGTVRGRSSSGGLPVLDEITRGGRGGKVAVAVGERWSPSGKPSISSKPSMTPSNRSEASKRSKSVKEESISTLDIPFE